MHAGRWINIGNGVVVDSDKLALTMDDDILNTVIATLKIAGFIPYLHSWQRVYDYYLPLHLAKYGTPYTYKGK